MPTFDSPEPISVTIHIDAGEATIVAGDRTDTAVEVRPCSPDVKADVEAAAQTRIEYAAGRLAVRTPRSLSLFGEPGSVSVEIGLPAASRLHATADLALVVVEGDMGACDVTIGAGDVRIGRAGPVELHTHQGDIVVERVTGDTRLTTGSGEIRAGRIDGAAEIRNHHGRTWIGEVTGDLTLRIANGDVTVGRAHGSVVARSAGGDTRLEEVSRGRVDLETRAGDLDIGVRDGSTARLDVRSRTGRVHSAVEPARRPADAAETVEVRARTGSGDITIRRVHTP
ncbi:hypothetical protein DMB42_09765 [Nonomuraea sp. WAC 01424]|uniref:DUF4097 family beta strand repeat-containing protein n=1 Tax=Nonomuraea sp. WAC 01424 TaxID=2203200 RepID=UPI000F77C45C|nr:DUF4097 family beta strand repeat-containing protein [Nonomuraea sp. WAC 01424]RSN12498.1 hypothetical protein DMB42_09765 [Nonomuraea sp. WAC 01424]